MRELKKADKEDVIVDNLLHEDVDHVTADCCIGRLMHQTLDWTAEKLHKTFGGMAKLVT